jgi:hypothetical protein
MYPEPNPKPNEIQIQNLNLYILVKKSKRQKKIFGSKKLLKKNFLKFFLLKRLNRVLLTKKTKQSAFN